MPDTLILHEEYEKSGSMMICSKNGNWMMLKNYNSVKKSEKKSLVKLHI